MLAGQKLTLFIFFICLQISTKLNLWHERKINELKVERCPVLPKYCRVPIVPTIIREYCSYNYQGICEYFPQIFILIMVIWIYSTSIYIFGFTLHLLYIWIYSTSIIYLDCLFVCLYISRGFRFLFIFFF